jgi:predicted nucleotidyltransferase
MVEKQDPLGLDPSDPLGQKVAEITQRILQEAQPRQIWLFGSGARGELGPDSDLDFLVIVREPVHRRRLEQQIYRNLHGVGIPVDVVVATEADIEKYGDRLGTVYRAALREGRVVYAA